MDLAIWAYLIASGMGFLGGAVCSLGLRWGISRRCYRLEVNVADLQRVVLSVKGQAGAEARWKKRDSLDQELLKYSAPTAANRERFANDPLGME